MPRGIIDLIKENKRRFYAGEIRNCFYNDDNHSKEKRENTAIINDLSPNNYQASFWENIKAFGHKFSEDLFYEPVK